MQLFCHIIGSRNLLHLRTHINAWLCANGHNIAGCITSPLAYPQFYALARCYFVMRYTVSHLFVQ